MKDKVIETAGRTWRVLAERGEVNVSKLPTIIKEKDFLVYQALGWLAREDKIAYKDRNRETFVTLIDNELQAFQKSFQNIEQNLIPKEKPARKKRT